jgi:glycolate oxidase iron-sulfur subunit
LAASEVAGFDDHKPPSRALLEECVHCGFCLPSCPTYVLWGEEADSPRGRIHLIGQVLDGARLEGSFTTHLDRCLSCMACVTACPSGVRYDELVEAARAQVERHVDRSLSDRAIRAAIFSLFPHPSRLLLARRALALAERIGLVTLGRRPRVARHIPLRLRTLLALAPKIQPLVPLPDRIKASGATRGVVGLLTGCVQAAFFSEVNAATARVLAAEGYEVVVPGKQPCCGALAGHAGREEQARAAARATIEAFEAAGVAYVVVNAAGCGSAMKTYDRLLADDPVWATRAKRIAAMTRDLSELLDNGQPRATRHPVVARVAYHDACHLAHAQQIREAPRRLLRAIPGLEVVEIPGAELCCGSAGVYNLLQPGPASELGSAKAAALASTGAEAFVTSNPGCLLQIAAAGRQAGTALTGLHLAEVLDASIRGVGMPMAGAGNNRRLQTHADAGSSPSLAHS